MLYKHYFKQFELCKLHVLSSTKISVPQSPMTNLIQTDEENSQAVIKTVTPQILILTVSQPIVYISSKWQNSSYI